jgi:O-acetylserine/cysteine efflux transporter
MIVAGWGVHAAVIKFGLVEVDPFTMAVLRYVGTALCLLPFAKFKKEHIAGIIKFGIYMNGLHFPFIFLAINELNASSFIVIVQLLVPISTIYAWFVYKEKIGLHQSTGIVLSFIGLLVIFGAPMITPLGMAYSFVAIIGVVLGFAELKRLGNVNPCALMGGASFIGLPVVIGAMIYIEPSWGQGLQSANWINLGGVLAFQVLAMSAAMVGWQRLLAANPMGRVVPFSLLQPVFGVAAGVLWLGESMGTYMIVGGLLVVSGVTIITFRKVLRGQESRPPAVD